MMLPLGKRETEVLEFKGRDKVKEHKDLGLEVVAFLNTKGGDLYIGLREENGIAVEAEPIENAESEARALRDFLVDKVEPKASPGEVDVSVIERDGTRGVLRVRVKRGAHGPYALLGHRDSRRFHVRIGERLRSMSREELVAAFSGERGGREDALQAVRRDLLRERDERQRAGEDEVWLAIQPARAVSLNTRDPRLETLLSDRGAIGVAPEAPSFHVPFGPEVRQDRLELGIRIPGEELARNQRLKTTILRNDGGMRFHGVLDLLYQHSTGSKPRVINPEVLIGLPLSLLRLAGTVLADLLDSEDRLVVDMALFGVGRKEALLSPGRWQRPRPRREARSYEDGDDLTLTNPPDFTLQEVRDAPDRCVSRLLSLIYEAFGYREDAIPLTLDPRTGEARVPA
jgi:hypothetical protein